MMIIILSVSDSQRPLHWVTVQSDQRWQNEPQQTHPRSVGRHGWCPIFWMSPLLSPWPRPGQEYYLDWLTRWALYLADPLLLTHTSDHLHHLGCVHEASQEKYFFNPIFPIIFMRRCWVWILTFFSSSEVFYYVYREVSETQCACWPEESVSYILKAHRNFSSEQDSSSGWVANMNS